MKKNNFLKNILINTKSFPRKTKETSSICGLLHHGDGTLGAAHWLWRCHLSLHFPHQPALMLGQPFSPTIPDASLASDALTTSSVPTFSHTLNLPGLTPRGIYETALGEGLHAGP